MARKATALGKTVRRKTAARMVAPPPGGSSPGPVNHDEVLWIEMKMRGLVNKAIGRYIGRPQDFHRIQGALCHLALALDFPPSGVTRCTGNWIPCPDNPKVCCPDCPPISPIPIS